MQVDTAPECPEAAWLAVSIPLQYAQRGSNLARAALAGCAQFETIVHHPLRDVVDKVSRTRFFYHAHPVHGETFQEHGHFHLFHEDDSGFGHLVALSLSDMGLPLRWFCTNQWVTGESWRPATRWEHGLHDFRIQTNGRLSPVANWLSAMVQLYRDELVALLHLRDAVVKDKAGNDAEREALFNDRQIHVLCSEPIDLQSKVQSLL